MQRHLDIDDGGHGGGVGTDVSQRRALEAGERVGAGEMDQEQIVLDQEVSERLLRQRACPECPHEFVRNIALPRRAGVAPQPTEQPVIQRQGGVLHRHAGILSRRATRRQAAGCRI